MYRLTIISGPSRGTGFNLDEGENAIGRQPGNHIVLPSAKVSKRHCVIFINGAEVSLRDQGSANGTFINGALSKERNLRSGDRISVGEYVLELSESVVSQGYVPMLQDVGALAPPPAGVLAGALGGALGGASEVGMPGMGLESGAQSGPPKDLFGRARWAFDAYLMPVFYGLNMKHEWKIIAGAIFTALLFVTVLASVSPLLEVNRASVVREMARRARFMARQIAESNVAALASKAESKTDVSLVENAEHVRVAVIVDLDNRVIAPAAKSNQYLVSGSEARFAKSAAQLFKGGRESGLSSEVDSATVAAIEPVKVLNTATGRNITIAMALVSLDSSMSVMDVGQVGTVYSHAIIFSGIFGVLAFLVLYRMTMKPFLVLNEDMDRVLKGELTQVTHEFKIEELQGLWDLINSSLQRIPRSGSASGSGGQGEGGPSAEDYIGSLQGIASMSGAGLVVLNGERKIVYLNSAFEELSGIRADQANGQEISAVARDQALGALVSDLCDRAQPGGEGGSEDFDFSGVPHKVQVVAFGKPSESVRCIAMLATRKEG